MYVLYVGFAESRKAKIPEKSLSRISISTLPALYTHGDVQILWAVLLYTIAITKLLKLGLNYVSRV